MIDKTGYYLWYTTWENDADFYKDQHLHFANLEDAILCAKFLRDHMDSVNSGKKNQLGNDGFNPDIVLEVMSANPDFVEFLELEDKTDARQFQDAVREFFYLYPLDECYGYSFYKFLRVVEKVKVSFVEIPPKNVEF